MMKITEIRPSNLQNIEAKVFKPELTEKPQVSVAKDKIELSQPNSNWQKDILLSALDMLESKISIDNDYPLDKIENRPIETFEEALIELQFIKTNRFKEEASSAQANISAEDILSLFIEDAA